MKKAKFIATIFLLMGVMCYLKPTPGFAPEWTLAQGQLILAVFGLGPSEGAEVVLARVPETRTGTPDTVAPPRDSTCKVEVTFTDSNGTELMPKFETELSPGVPTSTEFNPDPRPDPIGRNTYAAEVKFFGSNPDARCPVVASVIIYDTATGATRGTTGHDTAFRFQLKEID